MAHTRLRKFNTRDMYPEQRLDNDLCMVIRAGNHIFMRGQTGFDLDGNFHGLGDPAAQANRSSRSAAMRPAKHSATRCWSSPRMLTQKPRLRCTLSTTALRP